MHCKFGFHLKERDRNRWISVEQLHSRTAPPSDAWSFGVLLWEIATLGATPLHEIKTEDIKRRVERGARPPQLETFGDGLYQLMLSCWQIDKEERPDPETLACTLHELLPTANVSTVSKRQGMYINAKIENCKFWCRTF